MSCSVEYRVRWPCDDRRASRPRPPALRRRGLIRVRNGAFLSSALLLMGYALGALGLVPASLVPEWLGGATIVSATAATALNVAARAKTAATIPVARAR